MTTTAGPGSVANTKLQGKVHGGQQPVAGAAVYILEANYTGTYAGPGILPDDAHNSSRSLLVSGSNTHQDTNGNYYVSTDSGGNFSVTGDYVCDANQVVYLYATGGDAGAGNNSLIGLMAVLGVCPAGGGTDLSAVAPFVSVNELTTVAAAYALAPFASDATHIAYANSAGALKGIQNASANAGNLVNLASGTVYTQTPGSVTGNVGIVPYDKISALADILAACINASNGSASPACTTLFSNAQSNGSTGTTAADTATVAINIAHNPGQNVGALFGVQQGVGSPFSTGLSNAPNDWTLAVYYTGSFQSYLSPSFALDSAGDVWILSFSDTSNGNDPAYANGSLSKISPLGVDLSMPYGFVGGGLTKPQDLAIDGIGNVWVKNSYGQTVDVISEFSNAGIPVSANGYAPTDYTAVGGSIGFDSSGNLWSLTSPARVMEIYASGSSIGQLEAGPFANGNTTIHTLTVAANGNLWISRQDGSIGEFTPTGTKPLGYGLSVMGLNDPMDITFDKAGHLLTVDPITTLIAVVDSTTGTVLASSGSYVTQDYFGGHSIQVDGAGIMWVTNGDLTSISAVSYDSNAQTISAISPASGYSSPNPDPYGYMGKLRIDSSGNIWALDQDSFLVQYIGIAAPAANPINPATYGTRP